MTVIGTPPAQTASTPMTPWQGEFRGLRFGENTRYTLTAPIDFLGFETRVTDPPIPLGDGGLPMIDFAAVQEIPLSITIWGYTPDEIAANWIAALTAFRVDTAGDAPSQHWLRWAYGDTVVRVRCRVVRSESPVGPEQVRSLSRRMNVLLRLSDPRVYSDDETSVLVPVYDPATIGTGGYDLPQEELPFDVNALGYLPGAEAIVNNSGRSFAYPVVQVGVGGTGIAGFTLTNVTTGKSVAFIDTLVPGQTVTMDFDGIVRGTPGPHVTVDTTNRYANWTPPREPFYLASGNNRIRFETDPEATMDVSCRMSWRGTSQ